MGRKVIVVGAGIIGASIAWHLAREGAEVVVVDGGQPGGVATPKSWAWINASWGHPEDYVRLRMRSMEEWHRFAAEVPGLDVNWCGGLVWDLPEEIVAGRDPSLDKAVEILLEELEDYEGPPEVPEPPDHGRGR